MRGQSFLFIFIFTFFLYIPFLRLFPDEDLPPERVGHGRDLRERAEEGLEAQPRHLPRAQGHLVPPARTFPRKQSQRRGQSLSMELVVVVVVVVGVCSD